MQNQIDIEKKQATSALLDELAKGLDSFRTEGGLSVDEAFTGLED